MIEEIRIRDLGVITDATLTLGSGFTVVTGETGAGKTMVITALGLLLGDRAPALDFQPYFWTEAFGISLKSVGFTPVEGIPGYCEPGADEESMLVRWENRDGTGTAAALNYRIPVPKLRRLANTGPAVQAAV